MHLSAALMTAETALPATAFAAMAVLSVRIRL